MTAPKLGPKKGRARKARLRMRMTAPKLGPQKSRAVWARLCEPERLPINLTDSQAATILRPPAGVAVAGALFASVARWTKNESRRSRATWISFVPSERRIRSLVKGVGWT